MPQLLRMRKAFPKTLRVPRVSFAPLWGSDIQEPRDSWATWRRLYRGRKRNRLKSEIFSKSHIFAHLFFRVLGGGFRRAKLNRLGVRGNESPSHNYFSTANDWLKMLLGNSSTPLCMVFLFCGWDLVFVCKANQASDESIRKTESLFFKGVVGRNESACASWSSFQSLDFSHVDCLMCHVWIRFLTSSDFWQVQIISHPSSFVYWRAPHVRGTCQTLPTRSIWQHWGYMYSPWDLQKIIDRVGCPSKHSWLLQGSLFTVEIWLFWGQSSLNVETKETGQLVEILCQVALFH